MDNECRALVPYIPPTKTRKAYLAELFHKRRGLYFLMLTTFFIAAVMASVQYDFFLDDPARDAIHLKTLAYIDLEYTQLTQFILCNIKIILIFAFLFLSSLTIFSPIVSMLFTALISYNGAFAVRTAYYVYADERIKLIITLLGIAMMIFISIMYAVEVFVHFDVSSKSIKYILKRRNLLPIFSKTLLCLSLFLALLFLLNKVYINL